MTLTAPFLNFVVSRALDPESALATGAAFSLAILAEVVFLILGNKATIRRLTLLGASIAAVLTLACVWLAFTPAKTLLLTRVFNLSGQALVTTAALSDALVLILTFAAKARA